jgi:hypothetical protein
VTTRSTQAALADKAQRYGELTRLIADARRATAGLHDELVASIVATGEPIDVEGPPTLRLVDPRAGRLWDVKALGAHRRVDRLARRQRFGMGVHGQKANRRASHRERRRLCE